MPKPIIRRTRVCRPGEVIASMKLKTRQGVSPTFSFAPLTDAVWGKTLQPDLSHKLRRYGTMRLSIDCEGTNLDLEMSYPELERLSHWIYERVAFHPVRLES